MQQDANKMTLIAKDQQNIQNVQREVENNLLKFNNVVGVATGVKYIPYHIEPAVLSNGHDFPYF
jgi:hypothetical protein